MDPDWDADLNSRSYGIFIQTLATPRHVSNGLTKMVESPNCSLALNAEPDKVMFPAGANR